MNYNNCHICDSKIIHKVNYKVSEFKFVNEFKNLSIMYCEKCGFGFSFPELSHSFINEFYANVYRGENAPYYIDYKKLRVGSSINCRSLSQLLPALKYVGLNEGDSFLDIGPGKGDSFDCLRYISKGIKMFAIEPSQDASLAYNRLYNVKSFDSIEMIPENSMKLILMSHSLEHFRLSDIGSTLKKLKSILNQNGVLIIEVPHVDLRIHAEKRTIDDPHFLFFSLDSLRRLFENDGWQVLDCDTVYTLYPKISENCNHKKIVRRKPKSKFLSREKISSFINMFLIKFLKTKLMKSPGDTFHYGGDRKCLRIYISHKC